MKHIVFSGQLAVGKDSIADLVGMILKANHIGEWQRTAFAGAVKDIYCNAFNVTRDFVEKHKRNPEPPPGFLMNVRKSLQFIGDGFRQIQSDIWIDIALRNPNNVIISDGRYINEAKAVKDRGGINILVWRPGFENNDPNPSESQILPIVRWCLDTNQKGPIVVNACQIPSVREKMKPGEIALCMRPVTGVEYYDYFFRNDVELEDLRDKVEEELIPFLRHRYEGRCPTPHVSFDDNYEVCACGIIH